MNVISDAHDLIEQKKSARLRLQQMAAQHTSSDAEALFTNLNRYLKSNSGPWGGFHSFGAEPPVENFIAENPQIHWAFPQLDGSSMNFFFSKDLAVGKFGVKEAVGGILAKDLTGVLVPGLAFDIQGNRLGRGAGHFDRFLQSFTGLRIGVCWEWQILPEVPHGFLDQAMDVVITENKIRAFKRSK